MIGLDNKKAEMEEKLQKYQQHVHNHFSSKIKSIHSPSSYEVQYTVASLKWHPEFYEFLSEVQTVFTLSKTKMNYLIYTADNEAYTIVSTSSCKGSYLM